MKTTHFDRLSPGPAFKKAKFVFLLHALREVKTSQIVSGINFKFQLGRNLLLVEESIDHYCLKKLKESKNRTGSCNNPSCN